jgi:hypothetical protein
MEPIASGPIRRRRGVVGTEDHGADRARKQVTAATNLFGVFLSSSDDVNAEQREIIFP